MKGRRFSRRGFTLVELMIVVSIIGILALIAIPSYQNMRARAYDATSITVGRTAKMAQEVYYQIHEEIAGVGYADALPELLKYDRNLTDTQEVTFLFGYAGVTNFTFTTSHVKGTRSFIYHD